jgi:predicted acylesterase/phospholipase RssA
VASCALPLYFPPLRIGSRRCGDGGLRGVLPLEAAAHAGVERVIAIDVGPGFELAARTERNDAPPIVVSHDEAVGTLMASHTQEQLARWRAEAGRPPLTYVRPVIERFATFRIEQMREFAELGYRATRDALARPASRT